MNIHTREQGGSRRWRKAIVALALAVSAQAPLAAHADDPATAAAKAPAPGTYKGHVENSGPGTMIDPFGLIGRVKLDYALWTLMGEPVEDYLFRWELAPTFRIPTTGDLVNVAALERDAPELASELRSLAPLSVTLSLEAAFFDTPTRSTWLIGTADLEVTPDLVSPSGKPQAMSFPGSPNWDKWFSNVRVGTTPPCAAADIADCTKALWKRTRHLELEYPKVIHVEWPESSTRRVLTKISKFLRRTAVESAEAKLNGAAFWSKPSRPVAPLVLREFATSAGMPTPQRAGGATARQAQWKQLQERLATVFSVHAMKDKLEITVDPAVVPAAPVVEIAGKPLTLTGSLTLKSTGRVEYAYSLPFEEGKREFLIRSPGSPPIEQRRSVSCEVAWEKRFSLTLTAHYYDKNGREIESPKSDHDEAPVEEPKVRVERCNLL